MVSTSIEHVRQWMCNIKQEILCNSNEDLFFGKDKTYIDNNRFYLKTNGYRKLPFLKLAIFSVSEFLMRVNFKGSKLDNIKIDSKNAWFFFILSKQFRLIFVIKRIIFIFEAY